MRTEKQQQASRANGRRSHGPVTPEGQQRSSQNALRHGLLAKTIVMEHEDAGNFQLFLDQHVDRYKPFDDVEMNVLEEMVAAGWRLRRTWALQTYMLNAEVATHCGEEVGAAWASSFAKLASEPGLALLHRYETSHHRAYHRCVNTLIRLQKTRNSEIAPPAPPEPEPDERNETPPCETAVPNEPEKLLKTQEAAMPRSEEPKEAARSATIPNPQAPPLTPAST